MNNFTTNVGHIVTGIVIIIATAVLAWHGTITGAESIGIIAGIGGFSMGGSVASASAGAAVPVSASAPSSGGTSTLVTTANGTVTPVATFPSTIEPSAGSASQ